MIKKYDVLPLGITHHSWDFYGDVFAEVNTLAAQSHMMTGAEYLDVVTDPRIDKWVSTSDATPGLITGLGVQTNDLSAWPLVSSAYFERKWPKLFAERRIFYTGFVGVHPEAPANTFRDLLEQMIVPITAVNGVAVMDFCKHNDEVRHLPKAVAHILGRITGTPGGQRSAPIDRQEFWAYDFDSGALDA